MKSILNEDRWEITETDREAIKKAKGALGCSEVFAQLALKRFGKDLSFLIEEKSTHPPGLLKDLPRAAERIEKSLQNKEKIFIHGDFDVDGLSSAAILYRGLKKITEGRESGDVKVELGNRETGHGLSYRTTSQIIEEEFDLLITTDCGIKAVEEVNRLNDFGIETIITDHHKTPDKLPNAYALINPKRSDSNYPNPDLSGAGVAYKLMKYLLEKEGIDDPKGKLVQLAMLGTVADLSPLITEGDGENKYIVEEGLAKLKEEPLLGLAPLLDRDDGKPSFSPRDVSYLLAPKLNAANRVGDPRVGFLLLISQNKSKADHLASILKDYNRDRSTLQRSLVSEAEKQIKKRDISPQEEGLVFVTGEDWNPGLIGLVASQMADKYRLPAVAISVSNEKCRGSVRSAGKTDIEEGLKNCSHHLTRFGGHETAGGFLLKRKNIPEFEDTLREWVKENTEREKEKPKRQIDAQLDGEEISISLYREINELGPFGVANPRPVFVLKKAETESARLVGKAENHLKLSAKKGRKKFDCIGFGMGEEALREIKKHKEINPVFELDLNNWQGKKNIQLRLEDFVL